MVSVLAASSVLMHAVSATKSHVAKWHRLAAPPSELRLEVTLANGQAFNWQRLGECTWVGVVEQRVVMLRECEDGVDACSPSHPHDPPDRLAAALCEYFQLEASLPALHAQWREADPRMAVVLDRLPGLRVLRQEPVECLFSFICSSNNNIGRITGILERVRTALGEPIALEDASSIERARAESGAAPAEGAAAFFAFPTAERLARASEDELRALGLGYRARYVRESAALLLERGGADWLRALRTHERAAVQQALLDFPGVGRKVADCVALFSLDQHATIPVDVHVWQIACRDFDPSLHEAKSLTPALYERVGELFRGRYGAHAGWAHSALFAAELPGFRDRLPPELQQQMADFRAEERARSAEKKKQKDRRAAERAAAGSDAEGEPTPSAPSPPRKAPTRKRARPEPAAAAPADAPARARSTGARRRLTTRGGPAGSSSIEDDDE